MSKRPLSLLLIVALATCWPSILNAQNNAQRTWSDSTGKFTIIGSLIEVKDGDAYLKTADGKTMKIPVARLSKADQELLNPSANPFEELPAESSGVMPQSEVPQPKPSATPSTSSNSYQWSNPLMIDWSGVEEMDPGYGIELELPELPSNTFPEGIKRSAFAKKLHFFESMHALSINPNCKRAAVGATVSFSIPKPLTRVGIVDLVSGKSQNSTQIECEMRPLAVLNDGVTLLMVGFGGEGSSYEKGDELQLWKISGKKILRSKSWRPFDNGEKAASVVRAFPLQNDLVALLSGEGQLAVINVKTREPKWTANLGGNNFVDMCMDGKHLAVLSGSTVSIVDGSTGTGYGSISIGKDHIAWPKVQWSPSGKKLLIGYTATIKVYNLETKSWEVNFSLDGGQNVGQSLRYPDDDYALLNGGLLIHLPTQIQICDYKDASQIEVLGGKTFVALLNDEAGVILPLELPHTAAKDTLAQAQDDPSVFLIHPGVEVAIDAGGTGQYRAQVHEHLRVSAERAGYKIVPNAPIMIVATITGPTREAVNYIGRGSYTMDKYVSSVRLVWKGKDLWSNNGTNVQGMIFTRGDQSFEDAVNDAGKSPNLGVFQHAMFPKLLQKPNENAGNNGQQSMALLTSSFTLQGIVNK